jgi:hypothetical protein
MHRRSQPQEEGDEGKLLGWRSREKWQGEWEAEVSVELAHGSDGGNTCLQNVGNVYQKSLP